MKIAIMQPYFFPYLGYFQLINSVDKFIFLEDVNYIKRGWVNRNRVDNKGNAIYFRLQVSGASQNKKINELSVVSDSKWRDELLKTMMHSYGKSPNFEAVFEMIKGVVRSENSLVSDVCKDSIVQSCSMVGINTPMCSSTTYQNSSLKGQERIIDICKQEGASQYINPINGQSLYSKEDFDKNGIKLNFIRMNDDVPSLSIIDSLMKIDTSSLLDEYALI